MSRRQSPPIRIAEFLFQPSTGEIRPLQASGSEETVRLAPQPAQLLELLARKRGELVTREEIRDELWPDSHVDFDQSVNFCIRQIRAALGDSAAEPSYVETLPRRGYRLIPEVELPEDRTAAGDRGVTGSSRAGRWALAGAVLLLAVVAGFLARGRSSTTVASGPRLAIMPFELAAVGDEGDDLARISEWLVVEFSGGEADDVQVIGPRSTAPYSAFPFPRMRELAADLGADFVLNARYFDQEDERLLVLELIRLDDGTHPWADTWSDPGDWRRIAREAKRQVTAVLEPSNLSKETADAP